MAGPFTVHRLNPTGLERAERIAAAFDRLVAELDEIGIAKHTIASMVGGYERDLVITKLQEASFFAKRAMALNPDNQEP